MDGNGDTEAENVIRLPRDWVGPPEELVPIGSRARAREGRAEDRPADDGALSESIPDAGDFWGESASAVHHVMRAPTETQPAGRARRRRERPRLPRIRRRTALIAAIVGTTAVVVIIGVSEGHGPRPASATDAPQIRAQASATTSRAATTRPRHRSSTRAAGGGTRAVPVRAFSERPSARHIIVRQRRARRGASHPRHATNRPQRHPQSVITTATVVTTSVPTSVPTTPAPKLPVASTSTSTVATPATAARDGTRTTDTSTITHRSTTQSSGPIGPGEASGCDPKCS